MELKLPKLGEGADSGIVVNILVKEGDHITQGQTIIELENEKAVAPIPATAAGIVEKIRVKEGDKISVGAVLLTLAARADASSPSGTGGASAPQPAARPVKRAAPGGEESEPASEAEDKPEDEDGNEEGVSDIEAAATPSIRRMAHDLGIDLRKVRGSARGRRIVLSDLRDYVQQLIRQAASRRAAVSAVPAAPAKPPVEPVDFSLWGAVTKKPLSPFRKVIARRMVENWNASPHVTQFDDADVTSLLELRKRYASAYEAQGTRLTLTGLVLRALVAVLRRHPIFNASLDEATEEVVFKDYFHIGIAVDTEHGLIVPVIRDVDKKTVLQLSKDLEELARKARERKVTPEELKGGTFTISNQGGIGGGHFTPIVNKPQVAILGLGKGVQKAVVKDIQIVARVLLPLAVSYDHRLIDGGAAARFVTDLVAAIENFKEADVEL
jgi:pyruvate dehydrogenase E2 component (dihydrolipoamide acetyltransferase)